MLPRNEIDAFQQRLTTLIKKIQGNLGSLREEALQSTGGEASGSLSDLPLHPADLAGRQFEEDVSLALIGNEERLLEEVGAALSRLEQGRFGRCEQCRKAIAKKRLGALPYTRYCAACAAEQESGQDQV
ncbi:MAG: TraR/DksA C4-type zinc finger protein [Planctomycetes bacterium]|nr:TraR/DksA C4-type zinc finger protein [Planctomycetota bacterium]